jgi:thiol-disulfide isomerase/thioredoxin
MSYEITVILAKASWCPHCVDFTPIYNSAQTKINPANQLDGCKINFNSFELDKQQEEREFKEKYPELVEYLKGYPSVYLRFTDKKTQKHNTVFIDHTVSKEQSTQGEEQAAEDFINNIINKYKSILSGGKEEHLSVQRGGMLKYKTSANEVKYRNKYLKYKTKYLEFKNN